MQRYVLHVVNILYVPNLVALDPHSPAISGIADAPPLLDMFQGQRLVVDSQPAVIGFQIEVVERSDTLAGARVIQTNLVYRRAVSGIGASDKNNDALSCASKGAPTAKIPASPSACDPPRVAR